MTAEELEARLEQIDKSDKANPVDARIEGDAESGRLIISVDEKAGSTMTADDTRPPEGNESTQPVTLLEVGLSEVTVSDEYIDGLIGAVARKDRRDDVVLTQISSGLWELKEDWTHKFNQGKADEYSITVKKGSVYNRSSIPRLFWPFIGKDDLRNAPPLIHDLLYEYRGDLRRQMETPRMFGEVNPYRTFKRRDADNLFLELMKFFGVGKLRRTLAYQAVKNFAFIVW